MQNYNRLTVDLSAIQTNLNALSSRFPQTRLMAMVKGAAYGTDELVLANFYHTQCNIPIVGVSHVQEAVSLRLKGYTSSIFVIGAGLHEIETIVNYDLEVAVDQFEFCFALHQAALQSQKIVKVHMHLDTGMKRFGCHFDEAPGLIEKISHLPGLALEGIMTHFVGAESQHFDAFSKHQANQLEQLLLLLRTKGVSARYIHAANSAGALRFQLPFCNMMRVGLASFGLYSSEEERTTLSLSPALTLETLILSINKCRKGDTVGYCQTHVVTKENTRIAILPIGYHDGLHIKYSGKGYVLIHGKRAPYVGRICMDFMMVDISEIPEAKSGDPVLLFGKNHLGHEIPVETAAKWGNTNIRELIVCLGPRIERHFIYKGKRYDTSSERVCESLCAF